MAENKKPESPLSGDGKEFIDLTAAVEQFQMLESVLQETAPRAKPSGNAVSLSLGKVIEWVSKVQPLLRPLTEDEKHRKIAIHFDNLFDQLAKGKVTASLATLMFEAPADLVPREMLNDKSLMVPIPLPSLIEAIGAESLEKQITQNVREYDISELPDPFQFDYSPHDTKETPPAPAKPTPKPPEPRPAVSEKPPVPPPKPAPPVKAEEPVPKMPEPRQVMAEKEPAPPAAPVPPPKAEPPVEAVKPVITARPEPVFPVQQEIPPEPARPVVPVTPEVLPAPAVSRKPDIAPPPAVAAMPAITQKPAVSPLPAVLPEPVAPPPAAKKEEPADDQVESVPFAPCDRLGGLNANSATLEQWMAVPGMRRSLAGRIMVYRHEKGPFKDIFDLHNVPGLGASMFRAITGMNYNDRHYHRRNRLSQWLGIPVENLDHIPRIAEALSVMAGFRGCILSDRDGLLLAQSAAAQFAEALSAVAPRLLGQVRENVREFTSERVDHVSVCVSDRMFTMVASGRIFLTAIHETNKLTKRQFVLIQRVAAELEWLLSYRAYVEPVAPPRIPSAAGTA